MGLKELSVVNPSLGQPMGDCSLLLEQAGTKMDLLRVRVRPVGKSANFGEKPVVKTVAELKTLKIPAQEYNLMVEVLGRTDDSVQGKTSLECLMGAILKVESENAKKAKGK